MPGIGTCLDPTMKAGTRPCMGTADVAVLDRVAMDILDVTLQVFDIVDP